MKKIITISLIIVLSALTTGTTPPCTHIDDGQCGFNPQTEEGCIHD